MIETGAVTPADIDYVLANLWERGRREAERFGLTDPAALRRAVEKFVESRYSFAVRRDGRPAAIFGATGGPQYFTTWFLATEEMDLAETRIVRRVLHENSRAIPGTVIVDVFSAADHPKADAWFRLLGFKPIGEDRGIRRYRYVKVEK